MSNECELSYEECQKIITSYTGFIEALNENFRNYVDEWHLATVSELTDAQSFIISIQAMLDHYDPFWDLKAEKEGYFK